MNRGFSGGSFLLLVSLATLAAPASAQDLVEITAGTRAPGEIKSLRQGKLSFDLDDMGVVSIEVTDIVLLQSPREFEVQLVSGRRFFSRIEPGAEPGNVVLAGATYALQEIAELRPIEDGFWARTSGFVDVGFDAAKADANVSLTIGSEARYEGRLWGIRVSWSDYYQDRSGADRIRDATAGFEVGRLVGRRASVGGSFQYKTNDELSLEYRTQLGLGISRPLWRTPWTELRIAGWGLAGRESYADTQEATNSAELGLEGGFDAFRYASPELSHSTSLGWYPSLTESGRHRLEFNSRTSYELFSDFFAAITFKESYDSRPPSESAETETSDWTLKFSVGWSW